MKKIIFTIVIIILIIAAFIFFRNLNNTQTSEEETNTQIADENIENNTEENENLENNVTEETENANQIEAEEIVSTEQSNTEYIANTTEGTIEKTVSPMGFMGSSLYKVVLFSTGEVYVQKFDGTGTEESNIVSEELIAKNAENVTTIVDDEDEKYGEVIITGGTAVNTEYGWIEFE